jgi:hypothetical protein
MPDTSEQVNDWKMLTLVGLADRLVARTSTGKSKQANEERKNRWRASKKILRYILRKLSAQGSQAAAIKGLRDLEDARDKALQLFKQQMPDLGAFKKIGGDRRTACAFEPAEPEIILKAFCFVALRVRSTVIDAKIEDIVWHSFKHVVAPQLAAQLFLLEESSQKADWPKDYSAKGSADGKDDWAKPSDLLRAIFDGTFDRKKLQPKGPTLSLAEFKAKCAGATDGHGRERAKAALLLRILLQFCSDTEEDWQRARNMAGVILRHISNYDQQADLAAGKIERTDLSANSLAEFADLTSSAVSAELSQRSNQLDRTLNLPLTRRRILSYTPFITDPSSAELDSDFDGAVKMLRNQIRLKEGDDWARACMGYAYYMSRRCLVRLKNADLQEDEKMVGEAAGLTYDLMERAFETGAPATQQIALRYLAGFCTNPRFRCTALAQKNAKSWVARYDKSSPKGMTKLFKARMAFIANDNSAAIRLYQETFLRALPPEFDDGPRRASSALEDHEALAYLLPECYALAGLILNEKDSANTPESGLQRQIQRAGTAHFGVECDWPKEAQRILAGFAFRKSLLG